MSNGNNKYSLWIVPRGEAGESLQNLVNKLAIDNEAPVFVPHLTLVANIFADNTTLEREKYKVTQLAREVGQFTIRLTHYGYLDEEFRCLYLLAEQQSTIAVYEAAQSIFPQVADEHFAGMPHLSVLYGKYPEKIKQEIIKANPINPVEFTVTALDLYLTNDPIKSWQFIEKFEIS